MAKPTQNWEERFLRWVARRGPTACPPLSELEPTLREISRRPAWIARLTQLREGELGREIIELHKKPELLKRFPK